jgi:hypothetical protein
MIEATEGVLLENAIAPLLLLFGIIKGNGASPTFLTIDASWSIEGAPGETKNDAVTVLAE